MIAWGELMDFYKRGLGSVSTPTIGEALKSIRGTKIETAPKNDKEKCGTCKFYKPIGDGQYGGCVLWEKKAGRPMKVHTNWFCQGFMPNMRVTGLGSAMHKSMLSDSRNVVPGDAPWSKLGEYGNNVKLQRNGKPFAIMNFGNSVKTTLREGSHLPIADIFEIKSDGENKGVWTVEVTSEVEDGYFDSMLKQANYHFRFTMVPQIYSATPLVVEWVATDEALYDRVGSSKERVRRNVNRSGNDFVPAGQVVDLTGLLFADVDRPAFAKEGTQNHRITRRLTIKVRCRHG